MRKEWIKPFAWGMPVGAIVLLIVIFSTGWVVTSGSAQAKAEKAVVVRLAEICVAQFEQDPEKEQKLKELKEKNSWVQGDYVEKQNWATMPGSDSPDPDVAEECAKRIIELKP